MRLLKGMSGLPTECSDVQSGRNTGWPKNREVHGHGAIVVVGPGEGPGQGEGPQDRRGRTPGGGGRQPPPNGSPSTAGKRKTTLKTTPAESAIAGFFGERTAQT